MGNILPLLKPAYNHAINGVLSQSHPSYYRLAALKEWAATGPLGPGSPLLNEDGSPLLNEDGTPLLNE